MLKGSIFDFDGTLFDSIFIWNTTVKYIYVLSERNWKPIYSRF